ncbi:YceI family protein [Akkermansiaceae bacterium]|nr:YceI family protein [Akkermansiaceae bacterium]
MKKSILLLPTCVVFACSLNSCKNPADETTDAEVSESQTVAKSDADAISYVFAEGSKVNFVGSKVTGSHSGGFNTVTGGFDLNGETPESGKVVIDMTSVFSDNKKLTTHLKDEDFFDIATYPESTFEATGFEKAEDGTYKISGNLTMRGTTKNITFPAEVTNSEDSISVKTTFDIKRKDWGIVYKGKADDLIRDEVVISFEIKAMPKK